MNGRIAKLIRKSTKRNGKEYLRDIRKWSFRSRLRLAWWLLFGDEGLVK